MNTYNDLLSAYQVMPDEHYDEAVASITRAAVQEHIASKKKRERFGEYARRNGVADRIYTGESILALIDVNFFKRMGAEFFEPTLEERWDPNRWFEFGFTSSTAIEIYGFFRSQEFSQLVDGKGDMKIVFHKHPIYEVAFGSELELIGEAAKEAHPRLSKNARRAQRAMKKGKLGYADAEQIALGVQRASKNLSTLILTNDTGIRETVNVLREKKAYKTHRYLETLSSPGY